MGYDAEDAEAEYWHAKGLGYSDEEILAMDEWPVHPKPETPAMRARREGRAALARDRYLDAAFDQDGTMSAYDAAAFLRGLHLNDKMHGKITEEKSMPINTAKTAAELRTLIAEATKTLALLEKTPNEPAERMTTFGVTFPERSRYAEPNVYTYVALRINGKWTVTGRHFAGLKLTWPEIFARFDEIHATVKYVATPVEFRNEKIN